MDGLTFHKILRLLNTRYKGAALNRLSAQGSALYLSLYKGGRADVIAFSAAAEPALIKASAAIGKADGALKALTGSIVDVVDGRSYDSLGYIRLSKRKPSGKLENFTIVLEPMGKHANAFVLNAEGMILFNLTVKSIDSNRDIGVGKIYTPPKLNKIYSLSKPAPSANISFLEYIGFYPPTAKIADNLSLSIGFDKALEYLNRELESSAFYRDSAKRIFPFQDAAFSFEEIGFDELTLRAKDREPGSESHISEKLKNFYMKGAQHYESAMKKIMLELSIAEGWQKVQEEAELIKGNIHNINGQGVYKLIHYSPVGEEIKEYRYDSEEAPLKYMQRLFKKAGKLRRSIPHLQRRLADIEQLIMSAREQLSFIESASTADLKELFQLINRDRGAVNAVSQKEFIRVKYADADIYIGKNSAANYRLVFRFAKPSDIWLHAHNIPSAHAIIRTAGGKASEELIIYAAGLVAHFSKHSGEKSVEVDYALRRYVKKPPASPPGYVTYTNYKTVNVPPQADAAAITMIKKA
ncbi:MAG: NFACT family protein [Deferribacteraceae bacterium]|jgi:predicted ribosome quality control (RQC) complex YloA/Tae2 family protein|nr:NFACT family protein [Deferribacteraceae bacterium]